MKRITLALGSVAALAISATAISAQTELDSDGDGVLSFEELQAGYPDLTEEVFAAIDANGDGTADADELTAATDAGVLPAME